MAYSEETTRLLPRHATAAAAAAAVPYYTDYESFPASTHDPVFINEKESWYSPPENRPKLNVACLALLLLGVQDASLGSLLPLLQCSTSGCDDRRRPGRSNAADLAPVYLASLAGLALAAAVSAALQRKVGMRGTLCLGPLALLVSYSWAASSLQPQYYDGFYCCSSHLLLAYAGAGWGYGLINSCLLTWIGTFQDVVLSLTVLHSCYYVGGTLATGLVAGMNALAYPWSTFYAITALLAATLLTLVCFVFHDETAQTYAFRIGFHVAERDRRCMAWQVLRTKKAWYLSLFLFIASGLPLAVPLALAVGLDSNPPDPSHTAANYYYYYYSPALQTAYWLGLTAGSLAFYHALPRLRSLYRAVLVFLLLALVLSCFLLLLDPSSSLSSSQSTASDEHGSYLLLLPASLFCLGVCLGPLRTTSISTVAAVLPAHLHTVGVALIVSAAQTGTLSLPVLMGYGIPAALTLGKAETLVLIPATTIYVLVLLVFLWSFCIF